MAGRIFCLLLLQSELAVLLKFALGELTHETEKGLIRFS